MSIAWRAILVAGLAAGEEATLASLTGLFQREPERAAALVATARTRAINQSRHSEGHETYFRQRRRIEAAVPGRGCATFASHQALSCSSVYRPKLAFVADGTAAAPESA